MHIYMKYTFLLFCVFCMSSCGATGKLIGSVARLPVDIARTAAGGYDEGSFPDMPELDTYSTTNTLGHP